MIGTLEGMHGSPKSGTQMTKAELCEEEGVTGSSIKPKRCNRFAIALVLIFCQLCDNFRGISWLYSIFCLGINNLLSSSCIRPTIYQPLNLPIYQI